MRALLILNPAAGGGEPKVDQLSAIQTWIARGDVVAEVAFTAPEKTASDLTREGMARGIELFIVAGGDGTVSEVARELVGKEATLAILPVGTFNNIARSIGVAADLQAACGVIAGGEISAIDVGLANESEIFFEAAGIGLDATLFPIGEEIKGGRWLRMFEAARLTFGFRSRRIDIEFDRPLTEAVSQARREKLPARAGSIRKIRRRAMLVVVANGPYYGSGFTVAPDARLTDGELTVTVYRKSSKLELARHFWLISRGQYHYSPNVETYHAAAVTISARRPLPVHIDGKPIRQTPVRLRTLPGALRVMVPKRPMDMKEVDTSVALPAAANTR